MDENITEPSVLKTLGENIRKVRLLKGLTQENLASDLQKSVNFVSLLENGKTGLSIQTLVDICKALDIDANTLFAGIVPASENAPESFIIDSLNLFNDTDKTMVKNLITYIINSKN